MRAPIAPYSYDPLRNKMKVLVWQVKHSYIPERAPITIWVDHCPDGNPRPWMYHEAEEPVMSLKNHTLECRLAQETKSGGSGKYYNTIVGGDSIQLFLDSPYSVDWEEEYCGHPSRLPVRVFYENWPEGELWPHRISAKGKILVIDELADVRQASCLEAGIQGIRYLCRIGSRFIQLFLDGPFWVVVADELDFVVARPSWEEGILCAVSS